MCIRDRERTMAGSRLITISKAELSPNPVQAGKSYIVRVTLEKKAYWLDYPYDYAHDYAKGDESMSCLLYTSSSISEKCIDTWMAAGMEVCRMDKKGRKSG